MTSINDVKIDDPVHHYDSVQLYEEAFKVGSEAVVATAYPRYKQEELIGEINCPECPNGKDHDFVDFGLLFGLGIGALIMYGVNKSRQNNRF